MENKYSNFYITLLVIKYYIVRYATIIINIPYYITWIVVFLVFLIKHKKKLKETVLENVDTSNFHNLEEEEKNKLVKKGFEIGAGMLPSGYIMDKIKEMESYKPHINIMFWGLVIYFMFIN